LHPDSRKFPHICYDCAPHSDLIPKLRSDDAGAVHFSCPLVTRFLLINALAILPAKVVEMDEESWPVQVSCVSCTVLINREFFMSTSNFPKKLLVSVALALPLPYVFILLLQKFSPEGETAPGAAFYLASCLILVAYALLVQQLSAGASVSGAASTSGSRDRSESADRDQGADDTGPEGIETGTVKWFNVNKGYGFVTTSRGEDVFVHFRSIRGRGRRSLRQGQSVRFDLVDGDKGRQAENVSTLD